MDRKNILIIFSLVFIVLAIAAVTLSNKPKNITAKDIPHSDTINTLSDMQKDITSSGLPSGTLSEDIEPDSSGNGGFDQDISKVIKSGQIKVNHNTAEYDLKILICEDSMGEVYIKFEYYLEGMGMQKIVEKSQVPEVENIFYDNGNNTADEEGFKNIEAYLNPKHSKVYFIIDGRAYQKDASAYIYIFDLKESLCKKIFSKTGGFTGLYFSKDYKLMGFSYYNNTDDDVSKEKSLLQIFDCEKGMFIVSESRLSNGINIGGRDNTEYMHDYVFLSWDSSSIARIRESVRSSDTDSVKADNYEREILYDISKNMFMNLDGSIIKDVKKTDGQEGEGGSDKQWDTGDAAKPGDAEINAGQGDTKYLAKQGDTEGNTWQTGNGSGAKEAEDTLSIKALKEFYTCLSSEAEYQRALDMLSEGFKLELNFLKQFGVESLSKDDFKLEEATVYSSILKLIKLESIVREELSGDTSTIYYYQLFSIEAGSQMRQPIVAKIRKSDGKWLISSAVEVDDFK